MTEHERRDRLVVRKTLKAILGIPGDSGLSNPELAELVEIVVRGLRGQVEAYELARMLEEQAVVAERMDQ